jgi:hypothetical protein
LTIPRALNTLATIPIALKLKTLQRKLRQPPTQQPTANLQQTLQPRHHKKTDENQQTATSVQDVPKDIETNDMDNNISQDDATVDAGNSRATPQSSTPINASTTISKKYMDVQIKLEKVKSTKPIDALNACREQCKSWLEEIQQIETNNPNQTILHAIKDFPQDFNDLKTFFKNAKPIMKGGTMLYLKILASFDGEPNQLLSKVIW